MSHLTKSMFIYRFTCTCGACYIGRTVRQLIERIREHHPKWLTAGVRKIANSSILAHLLDNDHRVDIEKAFKVVYTISSDYPKGVRTRLLNTAEAVAMRLIKPDLCVHKQFVQSLALPWPECTQRNPNSHPIHKHINAPIHTDTTLMHFSLNATPPLIVNPTQPYNNG